MPDNPHPLDELTAGAIRRDPTGPGRGLDAMIARAEAAGVNPFDEFYRRRAEAALRSALAAAGAELLRRSGDFLRLDVGPLGDDHAHEVILDAGPLGKAAMRVSPGIFREDPSSFGPFVLHELFGHLRRALK